MWITAMWIWLSFSIVWVDGTPVVVRAVPTPPYWIDVDALDPTWDTVSGNDGIEAQKSCRQI